MSLYRIHIQQRVRTMTTLTKLLEPYTPKTQTWIVSAGIDLYERSKTLHPDHSQSAISTTSTTSPPSAISYTTKHYLDEIDCLRTQFEEAKQYYTQRIQEEYTRGRQEEQARHQTRQEQLQQDIDKLQEELTDTRRESRENREKGYKEGQAYSNNQLQELTRSLASLKEERDTLHENYQSLSQKLLTSRQEIASQLHQQYDMETTRLRKEIEQEKEEKREIMTMRDQMIQNRISLLQHEYTTQVDEMTSTIHTLEKQITRYQELYEATGKGIEYEKVMITRMEEYNHQFLGNQWHIQHVGQVKGGGKGDIQLIHRELGVRVIIDVKNKNDVGKSDIQKFIHDVETLENQCDIGMLIARGRIFTKRLYHMEQPKEKLHMYISNFKPDQIGLLFTSLDMACEKWRNGQQEMNMDEYREHLWSLFLFFRKQHDQALREVDKMKAQMTDIGNIYYKWFHANIELDMEATKKTQAQATQSTQPGPMFSVDTDKQSSGPSHLPSSSLGSLPSLDELETTCDKVIGRRSKYVMMYTDQGQTRLHYFRGNSARQKKQTVLHQKGIATDLFDM